MGIAGHWHCDYGTSSRTVQCSSHIALHQEPTIVLEYKVKGLVYFGLAFYLRIPPTYKYPPES